MMIWTLTNGKAKMAPDQQRNVAVAAFRAWLLCTAIVFSQLVPVTSAHAALDTVVPISAELGTSIAGDLFPVTVKLSQGNIFLTEPVLLFLNPTRISLQLRFQAYDHRPQQNIAISEMGQAVISGRLGYDPGTRQVLLYDAKIDKLQFDKRSAVTDRLLADVKSVWSTQITNPIRADIPPHPYLLPFKNNIQGLSYDGTTISVALSYK